jgi:hypothetical protein
VAAALAALPLLAGCGSSDKGLDGPRIGKARSFEVVGLTPKTPVKAGRPTTLRFHIRRPDGSTLTKFKTGAGPHTGVHLIVVRDDLSQIIHRHPPVAADGSLTQRITFPSAGPWHVVVDVYPDLGVNTLPNFQLTGRLRVECAYRPRSLPALRTRQRVGGLTVTLRKPRVLRSLRPQFLAVDVRDAGGRPARFDQYYGALAHAIFFRRASLAYFHTHVCGAGASACASAVGGSTVTGRSTTPGKLRVGMLIPTAGTWKLFLQAKVQGRIVTIPYTLDVS